MSQPINYYVTRWDLASNGEAKFVSNAFGGFVAWHDYGTLINNYAAHQAENERLRKAGDAMENELFRVILMELPGLEKEDINNQYIADWRAAKGVQS